MASKPKSLNDLPMFASDREIAVAIVGPRRASDWLRDVLPMLERQGFPPKDPFHEGRRPVPLVRRFYEENYLRMNSQIGVSGVDGPENPDAWRKKRQKRI